MPLIHTATLDLIDHPVFVLERDFHGVPRYVAFNNYACKRLDKPAKEIVGLTAAELYPGRLGVAAYNHHCETFRSGQPRVYEIPLPIGNAQMLVRTNLRPIFDKTGEVFQVVGCSQDISGQQMFRELEAEVLTITSEVEDFINLAAHDLRTPMRQVAQIADMLREDFQDMGDGKLQLIDMLADLGESALRLIGDILAHAQATNVVEQVNVFHLRDLVAEIMTLLDPMGDCEITCDNAAVRGDRTAIQIILRNLIDNAIKYAAEPDVNDPATGDDARALKLQIHAAETGGELLQITVRDNGVGFGEPALVFLGGGRLYTDSGFGLLGVRRLIHARGGMITVTNRPDGNGADVRFSLPGQLVENTDGLPEHRTRRPDAS